MGAIGAAWAAVRGFLGAGGGQLVVLLGGLLGLLGWRAVERRDAAKDERGKRDLADARAVNAAHEQRRAAEERGRHLSDADVAERLHKRAKDWAERG